MPDETQAESSPAATDPVAPEATLPESATPQAAEVEESATSANPESEQDESVTAPEAAKQTEEGRGAERRIKQLTAQVRQLQRQMQQPQQRQQQMMQAPAQPKLEQYENIEDYDKALGQWREADRQFAIQQDRMARDQEARKQAEEKQTQEARATWDKRSQRILKENPDFNVVEALQRVEPSPTMDIFFPKSEVGPEILDYLDTNPDEADRIREMDFVDTMRELIKLEDRLSLQVKGIKAKPTLVTPPSASRGRASAPAAPKTAADVLYG